MKAKQMRFTWDQPQKAEPPQKQPSNDIWEPGELIDDSLPPHVLKIVNELIWGCWITEGIDGSFAHELLLEEVSKSIDRWTRYAEKKIVEELQEETRANNANAR